MLISRRARGVRNLGQGSRQHVQVPWQCIVQACGSVRTAPTLLRPLGQVPVLGDAAPAVLGKLL